MSENKLAKSSKFLSPQQATGYLMKNKPSPTDNNFLVIVIMVRVFVVLVLWLAMFLTLFLGYFTIPFILMVLITAVFLLSDLSIFAKLKRSEKTISAHQEFIESLEDDTTQKKE